MKLQEVAQATLIRLVALERESKGPVTTDDLLRSFDRDERPSANKLDKAIEGLAVLGLLVRKGEFGGTVRALDAGRVAAANVTPAPTEKRDENAGGGEPSTRATVTENARGPVEYRFLHGVPADDVNAQLNTLAHAGFRLVHFGGDTPGTGQTFWAVLVRSGDSVPQQNGKPTKKAGRK